MKKPQITRMQSQLRQVRIRSARHCQSRANEQDESHTEDSTIDRTRQRFEGRTTGRDEMMH